MLGYKIVTGEILTGDSRLIYTNSYHELHLEQKRECFDGVQKYLKSLSNAG